MRLQFPRESVRLINPFDGDQPQKVEGVAVFEFSQGMAKLVQLPLVKSALLWLRAAIQKAEAKLSPVPEPKVAKPRPNIYAGTYPVRGTMGSDRPAIYEPEPPSNMGEFEKAEEEATRLIAEARAARNIVVEPRKPHGLPKHLQMRSLPEENLNPMGYTGCVGSKPPAPLAASVKVAKDIQGRMQHNLHYVE